MERQHTDMDYRDEISFQKNSGHIKKMLQILLLLIVIACLGGIFGYGGWTKKTEGNKNDIEIEYEKMLRATKKTPLSFFINSQTSDTLKIKINLPYISKVSLESVEPKPFKTSLEKEHTVFYFIIDKPGIQKIIFNSIASKSGKVVLNTVVNGHSYFIHQFIFP